MKRVIKTTAKITWIILGVFIVLWTIFWYYQIKIVENIIGIFTGTILFASGLTILMFFMLATSLFITIKYLAKKRK